MWRLQGATVTLSRPGAQEVGATGAQVRNCDRPNGIGGAKAAGRAQTLANQLGGAQILWAR